MNPDLRYHLLEGPYSVKNLKRLTEKSETWVRAALKEHATEIQCRKDSTGQNVFWLAKPEDSPEAPNSAEEQEAKAGDPDTPYCPLCHSFEEQKAAGEEGTFLGACLTCPDCKKTYNRVTEQEVKDAPTSVKGKRKVLNPQHKIRAKVEAVEKAGGSLAFDKNTREWVFLDANDQGFSMTAARFATETPETMTVLVQRTK